MSLALINALPLQGIPDLVRLHFESNESVCTGFFINKTTIITAAHCFYSYKDERLLKVEAILSEDDKKLPIEAIRIISHPKYYQGGWSPNDVGIIKVSANESFKGNFSISNVDIERFGNLTFYGAGKINIEPKEYGRSYGQNNYIKFGSFLYLIGQSKHTQFPGNDTSIAPNDSGAPVVENSTGKVIGIAYKASVAWTCGSIIPALSVITSIGLEDNWQFIQDNL
jgi:V8-like Glu-specific endopeptidase